MTYNQLQKRATEMGMDKVVGKTTEELEKYIAENAPTATQPSPEAVEAVNQSDFNSATVMDGTREVRKYDLETHGDGFAKLAQEFAGSRGFRVEMGYAKGKTICPSCGHAWN